MSLMKAIGLLPGGLSAAFTSPLLFAATVYQASVHQSLKKYGLQYEDIIIAEHPDYQTALKYIPHDEYVGRQRRIRRAIDISLKHEYLPAEIQALQTPGKVYMAEEMEKARKRREEREWLRN